MKKVILVVAALMLTSGSLAFSAIQSKSKAQKPVTVAKIGNGEDVRMTRSKKLYSGVRCKNGTVSYSRQNVCVGRGGPLLRPDAGVTLASSRY
ncbi:hypothetical protein BH11PSE11_BH11PSE11_29640 [soil metagenome]